MHNFSSFALNRFAKVYPIIPQPVFINVSFPDGLTRPLDSILVNGLKSQVHFTTPDQYFDEGFVPSCEFSTVQDVAEIPHL